MPVSTTTPHPTTSGPSANASGMADAAAGNTRLAYIHEGTSINKAQETHYYPFGHRISPLSNQPINLGTERNNAFLYNGKEFNDDFGLNWYDYGARFYDPQLGRWHSVDPLAEEYRRISPYVYCVNNPIRFLDPDGRWVPGVDRDGNVSYTAENNDNFFTFMTQYGLSRDEATSVFTQAGLNNFLPQTVETVDGSVTETTANMGEIKSDDIPELTQSAVSFTYSNSFGGALSLDVQNATGKQLNEQLAFMINYETQKGSFEANFNSYFQNVAMPGIGTNHNNPTKVNFLGKNTAISFDYGKRSDGRFMPRSANPGNLHDRTRWEFNHPDALMQRGKRKGFPNSIPILTVYTHD